jgi:phosphoribosylglycinamide formyltransferase-1
MKRIVILISGRGSNMEAVVRACDAQAWPASVVAVISNRPQASGLDFARSLGLQAEVVDHRAYADRAAFDEALAVAVERYLPDLVVLAGFMRILGEGFVQLYAGRLLNIHPSLLPAFPGLHTHQRALQAGCKIAGATVHLVTAELDHGPVVVQAAVPVLPGDDEASLAARVLQAEHQIYPKAVGWFVKGLLEVRQGVVWHTAGEPQHLWFN